MFRRRICEALFYVGFITCLPWLLGFLNNSKAFEKLHGGDLFKKYVFGGVIVICLFLICERSHKNFYECLKKSEENAFKIKPVERGVTRRRHDRYAIKRRGATKDALESDDDESVETFHLDIKKTRMFLKNERKNELKTRRLAKTAHELSANLNETESCSPADSTSTRDCNESVDKESSEDININTKNLEKNSAKGEAFKQTTMVLKNEKDNELKTHVKLMNELLADLDEAERCYSPPADSNSTKDCYVSVDKEGTEETNNYAMFESFADDQMDDG